MSTYKYLASRTTLLYGCLPEVDQYGGLNAGAARHIRTKAPKNEIRKDEQVFASQKSSLTTNPSF